MKTMNKLFIIGILFAVLLIPSAVLAAELPDLTGHWAEGDVRELVAMGAISGYPDGTYRPQNTITRAEFSSVMGGALGLADLPNATFADTAGHWGEGRIEALVQAGVIDTALYGQNYNPNGAITREEIAMMTVRMLGTMTGATDIPFIDNDQIGAGYHGYVAEAYGRGIIRGYPDDTFRPKGNATRAEAAVMAVRALRILGMTDEVPTIVSFTADFESIFAGSTATLGWEVTGATAIAIAPNVGAVSPYGSVEVSPAATTTYTLTATNNTGSATAQVTIDVTPFGGIIPPPNGFILPPPSIASFTVDREILPQGQTATLSWEVSGVAAVTIAPGIGEVSTTGTRAVSPAETTTYTLTASNASGSVSETVKISVARQVVIQPGPGVGMDTFVFNYSQSKNYGTRKDLQVGTDKHIGMHFTARALLQYDLSSIPQNAVIVSADLSLYQHRNVDGEAFNVSAHQIITPWDYLMATWNNQPHYAKTALGTKSVTPGVTQWVSWNIRSLVQDWVSGSTDNHGLVLKKANELAYTQYSAIFFSSRADSPGVRPRLDITYYLP